MENYKVFILVLGKIIFHVEKVNKKHILKIKSLLHIKDFFIMVKKMATEFFNFKISQFMMELLIKILFMAREYTKKGKINGMDSGSMNI